MKGLINAYLALMFLLLLSGCYRSGSDYEAVSYKNLVDLRDEMRDAFNTYNNSGAKGDSDFNNLKKFKTDISKDYDYARDKEKDNEVINQWNVLNNQMDEMIQTFQQNDSLTSGYCLEKWNIMDDAFNKAIKAKSD